MSIQTYTASVSRVRDLTHDVRELEMMLVEPKDLSFKPGQLSSRSKCRRKGSPLRS